MRLLHRMLLRALPAPFFGAAGTLVFLLLLQFLIRFARDLFGKGLPVSIIAELIVYSLAYILTLAIPMAAFVASIVAFARLAESQAYAAAQAAGISLRQLVWPVLLVATTVGLGLAYFTNVVLPKSRVRATQVRDNIANTQPGLALEPGVFYTGLSGYAILAQRIPEPSRLEDLFVVDQTRGTSHRTMLRAKRGRMVASSQNEAVLILEDGSLVRDLLPPQAAPEPDLSPLPVGVAAPPPPAALARTEALAFTRLALRLDVSRLGFRRDTTGGYRGLRSRPTPEIVPEIRDLEATVRVAAAKVDALGREMVDPAAPLDSTLVAESKLPQPVEPAAPTAPPRVDAPLAGLDSAGAAATRMSAQALLSRRRLTASVQRGTLADARARANLFRLELHKRQTYAVACVVLALAGALLGLRVNRRHGGLARVGIAAVAIFLFYWVTLVTGAKFSEQGIGPPWLGQWIANLLIGGVSVYLLFDGPLPRWKRIRPKDAAPDAAPTA